MQISVFVFLLPATSSYTSFQGLLVGVNLQNAFQELKFSYLIVDAYLAYSSKYSTFRWVLSSSFIVVLWVLLLLLKAFILLCMIVSSSVHQGTDLFVVALLGVSCVLKDPLHAAVRFSYNSSIVFSTSLPNVARLASVEPRSPCLPVCASYRILLLPVEPIWSGICLCCAFALCTLVPRCVELTCNRCLLVECIG